MPERLDPLPEEVKAILRQADPDWARNMCCGEPFKCGGCYVDAWTGA